MKIQVYLDDGRVFEYAVSDAAKAREHSAAIVKGGYRHNDGNTFEHYPAGGLTRNRAETGLVR